MLFQQVVNKEGDFIQNYDTNWELLKSIDQGAKAKGELKHRYIQESCADSYAYYQIVKVNKKTVKITHLALGGDDWVIPYWGYEAIIDRAYAEQSVSWRDNMDALFEKRGA